MPGKGEHTVEEFVRLLERELGIPERFLESLYKEDDWSFIIKTHALLEAAVSHLLCRSLGREELSDPFSNLELSGKRAGKMAFVEALDLLDKPDRRFVSSLSELRNDLVHNVSKIRFDLKNHVASMENKKLASFATKFNSFSIGKNVKYRGKNMSAQEVFKQDPKTAIWWSAMVTVAIIYSAREIDRLQKESERLSSICNTLCRLSMRGGE